jgi:hypothetical protein
MRSNCSRNRDRTDPVYWLYTQSELWRAYMAWCDRERRHRPLGIHNFGDHLRNAFSDFGLREDTATHKIFGVHPRITRGILFDAGP